MASGQAHFLSLPTPFSPRFIFLPPPSPQKNEPARKLVFLQSSVQGVPVPLSFQSGTTNIYNHVQVYLVAFGEGAACFLGGSKV